MKMFCLLFICGVVLSFRWRTWCWKSSRRPRSATLRRMIWRLKTSSSVLFGPPRSNSSRNWITCWTLSAAWRNRTKNCASLLCLLLFLLPLLHESLFCHQTNQIGFWLQRKAGRRRTNEGVAGPARGWAIFLCECVFGFFGCFFLKENHLEAISKHTLCFQNIPVKNACCLFLPKQFSFSFDCQIKC